MGNDTHTLLAVFWVQESDTRESRMTNVRYVHLPCVFVVEFKFFIFLIDAVHSQDPMLSPSLGENLVD